MIILGNDKIMIICVGYCICTQYLMLGLKKGTHVDGQYVGPTGRSHCERTEEKECVS